MPHKRMTARITEATTDRGEFTALAATYSIDRAGDQITPGAFAETIRRWRARGSYLPLHWNHSGKARNIIGRVDPTMRETLKGLYVEGKLDLKHSAVAREAWRATKTNAIGLSFGFMIEQERKRYDGVRELRKLDLFEISLVPAPANPDARILSMKGRGEQVHVQVVTFAC